MKRLALRCFWRKALLRNFYRVGRAAFWRKILNLTIGEGCTKSMHCKVDFGYKFKIFSRPKKPTENSNLNYINPYPANVENIVSS